MEVLRRRCEGRSRLRTEARVPLSVLRFVLLADASRWPRELCGVSRPPSAFGAAAATASPCRRHRHRLGQVSATAATAAAIVRRRCWRRRRVAISCSMRCPSLDATAARGDPGGVSPPSGPLATGTRMAPSPEPSNGQLITPRSCTGVASSTSFQAHLAAFSAFSLKHGGRRRRREASALAGARSHTAAPPSAPLRNFGAIHPPRTPQFLPERTRGKTGPTKHLDARRAPDL